jgi:hypothetical protein
MAKPKPFKKEIKKEGDEVDLPLKGTILTVDTRNCLGVCTTNAIPGTLNAPEPPIEAALG